MKKIVCILSVLMCFVLLLCACSDNSPDADLNTETESVTDVLSQTSDTAGTAGSDSSKKNPVGLEDITAEYVEPDFKIVTTLEECLNYIETDLSDTVEKETDSNGNVTSVTVTDSDGQVKGTVTAKYNDDSIDTSVNIYSDGEVLERFIFIFNENGSVSTVGHVDADSKISVYLYNDDGTFNSYIDSDGFSSLLSGTIMSGFGEALFG